MERFNRYVTRSLDNCCYRTGKQKIETIANEILYEAMMNEPRVNETVVVRGKRTFYYFAVE